MSQSARVANSKTTNRKNVNESRSVNRETRRDDNRRASANREARRDDGRRASANRNKKYDDVGKNATRTNTKAKKKTQKPVEPVWIRGGHPDFQCLFLVVVLVGIGLMMTYSASYYRASILEGGATYKYLKTQALAALLGLVAIIIFSNINYRKFSKLFVVALLFTCGLSIIAAVNGVASHGASRWIAIGGLTIQPSEFAKISLIIYMATMCSAKRYLLDSPVGMFKMALLPIFQMVCILGENLSSAIICFVIVFGIMFIASPKVKYLIILAVIGVIGVVIAIFAKGYRGERFDAWLHPETAEKGLQVRNSLYAIGSGGLFGRGYGKSIETMGFLPEAHNDMIFSVICEEFGFVGGLAVIILFAVLLWRLKTIASDAPDAFGSLIVTGVMAHIAFQMIVNLCVCTNLFPNTGVPLPFVSYGGTAMMCTLAEIGLVMSVSRQTKIMTAERVKETLKDEFEG